MATRQKPGFLGSRNRRILWRQSARGCLRGKRHDPSEDGPFGCCRFRRQAAEQYRTWSQQAAHFFRQAKGRPQAAQVLLGRWGFAWGIVSGLLGGCDGLLHRTGAEHFALAERPVRASLRPGLRFGVNPVVVVFSLQPCDLVLQFRKEPSHRRIGCLVVEQVVLLRWIASQVEEFPRIFLPVVDQLVSCGADTVVGPL